MKDEYTFKVYRGPGPALGVTTIKFDFSHKGALQLIRELSHQLELTPSSEEIVIRFLGELTELEP